jgi:Bacterial TniB protein
MVVSGEGEFEHLDARYRRFAAAPDEERIALIKADRWIGFEHAQAALDRLEALLAYPPRDRMPCLLIYGGTGMGKTKIVRKFEGAHAARFSQATGTTHRPVVVAQIPSEPVERDLYRELVASLRRRFVSPGGLRRGDLGLRADARTATRSPRSSARALGG